MDNILQLSHRSKEPESGVLYLVGTPIGNLNDISPRALNILQNTDFIACEDTRETKKIIQKYGISNKLISFNKHNSLKKSIKIISDLKNGKSIALVSDAGMPSICDPGEDLVNKLRHNGLEVICIPGPCAALTALVSSGMPSSKFIFEGFLPRKKQEKEKILSEISNSEKTTIIFESPHRLRKLLEELKAYCGGEREIHVSRELTKKFEEHICSNISEVIKIFENKKIIGEFTIVISGTTIVRKSSFDEIKIRKDLHELVAAGLSLSAASKYLSKKEKISKNIIYKLY